MKTIGIIPNPDRDIGYELTGKIVEKVIEYGGKVLLPLEPAQKLGYAQYGVDEDDVYKNSNVILSLGGDGTYLKVARNAYTASTPVLGVNLGTLGFLTDIEKGEIDFAIKCIIDDKYTVENRMMLETVIYDKSKVIARDIALNDVVVSRGALSRILHLKTYINDVFAEFYPGDGLIVSSPTGSTAYSLSAGGPIVEPDLDIIIVSPICPHILYARSFITKASKVLKVVVDENYEHTAMVTVDGQIGYEIRGGYSIEVKKAPYSVQMVKIVPNSVFNVLRSKIYVRGETFKDEVQ